MKILKLKPFTLLTVLMIFAVSACDKDKMDELDVDQLIEEVRETTAPYSDLQAAMDAGWNTDLSGCVEHPTEGGMGHHFARFEYMDGRVNHLEPQILLYVLDATGNMNFVGVEYVVPFSILPEDSEAPVLFDQSFHKNQEQQLWALHVWTERNNDKGMFNDWNPDVSCSFWIDMLVDDVRAVTRDLRDFDQANAQGWNTDLSGCVEHPTEGGMGHHIARLEFMDGRVNHLEPQILLFLPNGSGVMQLLGVEYVVPFAVLPEDSEPPVLFNQPFHKNHEQEIWALHVWTEKENPNGIFADWNPTVECN